MADMFTTARRSEIMASIRSKRNQTTELLFENILRRAKITGWRRHIQLEGKPDYTFRHEKVVVFIDGCFWHCCPAHGTRPKSNKDYWVNKLKRNRERDRRVSATLRKKGWRVIRFWEHGLKSPSRIISKLQRALDVKPLRSEPENPSIPP